MKKFSAALALVLACAGPAVAAKPPKGGGPSNIQIHISAPTVTFGKSVTITGSVKNVPAGTSIELQESPYPYAAFKSTGKTAVVDPTGNYAIAGVIPQMNTQYKVIAKTSPPSESKTVFVRVSLRVTFKVSDSTPKRGAKVRFYGTVAPAHDGKPILIQKKTSTGAYKTVART